MVARTDSSRVTLGCVLPAWLGWLPIPAYSSLCPLREMLMTFGDSPSYKFKLIKWLLIMGANEQDHL